jgi:hypothetical protein
MREQIDLVSGSAIGEQGDKATDPWPRYEFVRNGTVE